MFRVGVTRDFLTPDGALGFGDIGLAGLDAAGVPWEWLPAAAELPPEAARDYDGLLVLGPRVTAATLAGVGRLRIVARFGVGYDNVDVPACTAAGVVLTITPEGVRRPVAVAAMTFVLALSHKLLIKDRLTRQGRWAEKLHHIGQGLTGRTLGLVGLGNIGRELAALARPFDLRVIAADPWAKSAPGGVALVGLETLLREADYVCLCCALTAETRHLINAGRLALMKPSAYLINVARGPIVDQAALTGALERKEIAGAGLDVFDPEPIAADDPLLALDNVIVAPHAICWTDECFSGNGRSAVASLLAVASGRVPENVVNREALAHARWGSHGGDMRPNKVKQVLKSGGVAMGVMCLEFATSGLGRLSAEGGAELAVFDMEHTGWSLETIKMLVATSRGADLEPIVRVPATDYHHIAHALDVGASGLVIPLVRDAAHIKEALDCALYPPRGRRGCAFGLLHDDYTGGAPGEKMRHANDNLLMIAQIETAEGLANVEEIAAVEGVDALWMGQFDLTASLGIPAQFDHPKFLDAAKRIVEACRRHGKAAALAVLDVEQLAAGPSNGYRLLVYAADLWIYQQALRRCFTAIRAALGRAGEWPAR